MLILIVASGPDKGRIYELCDDKPVVLGREGDPIKFNDRKSSRKHARLWAEGGQWYVQDQNSRHGTYINGEKIADKTPLHDGDHVQVGNTMLVLARMPVEQVERLALLGDANDAANLSAINASLPAARRRRPLLVAAGLAAAVAIVGVNVYTYLDTSRQNEQLRDLLASRPAAAETPATAAAPQASDPLLKEILAAVKSSRHDEQVLTDIHDAVMQQPQRARPILDAVLAQAEAQRTQASELTLLRQTLESQQARNEPVLRELLAAAQAAESNRQTLARLQDQLPPLGGATAPESELAATLDKILAELKRRPTTEQLLEPLQEAIARSDGDTRTKLEEMLAHMERQAQLEQSVRDLRQTLAEGSQQSEQMLSQVLTALEKQPTSSDLAAQLALVQETVSQRTAAMEERVLAKMQTPTAAELDQQFAELRALIAQQPEALAARLNEQSSDPEEARDSEAVVLAAIAELKEALPGDSTPLLQQVLAQLAAQRTLTEQLAELKPLIEQQPDAVAARLNERLAQIEASADPKTLLAAIDELKAGLPADAAPVLAKVLAELEAQPSPEQIAAAVREAVGQGSEEQVLAKLNELDARLADAGPDQQAMRQVLREIRSRTITGLDELRATVRSEVQAALKLDPAGATRLAEAPAVEGGSEEPAAPVAATPPADAVVNASPVPLGRSVLLPPEAQEAGPPTPRLSETELAYKLAFETGQPVTIGAGAINPATGKVSEGRTLDPAAAKAAGIKHWRDWYLMDDFAERMRLQKQAMRHAHEEPSVGPVIGLPPATEAVPVTE